MTVKLVAASAVAGLVVVALNVALASPAYAGGGCDFTTNAFRGHVHDDEWCFDYDGDEYCIPEMDMDLTGVERPY